MTTPHSPPPRPIQEAPSAAPALDPNSLIAILHAIGAGAAADGQPWPERHHLRSRQMALSDADCALTGQRIVQEILLAAERTRQNGEPEQYVGDRVMEGLVMADLALTAFIDGQPWPEQHHLRSRQMALSDADCALTGQRIVQEILLAAERTRQNGEPEQYVGDRVMEGLVMADLALTAFIHERVRPKD